MELKGLKGRCGVPLEGHWFLMRYYAEMVRVCMQTGRPALGTIAVSFVLFFSQMAGHKLQRDKIYTGTSAWCAQGY